LQYYIHRCLGPCSPDLTTYDQYQEAVKDVRLFLEARNNDLIKRLSAKMDEASNAQQYELAAHYRDAIDTMETLAERQKMAVMGTNDIDIFGFITRNIWSRFPYSICGAAVWWISASCFGRTRIILRPGEFFQSVC
jgi:excinuclease ABC subunit C